MSFSVSDSISAQLLQEEKWAVATMFDVSRWIHEGTDTVDYRLRHSVCTCGMGDATMPELHAKDCQLCVSTKILTPKA